MRLGISEQDTSHPIADPVYPPLSDDMMSRPVAECDASPALCVLGVIPVWQDILVDCVGPLIQRQIVATTRRHDLDSDDGRTSGAVWMERVLADDVLVRVSERREKYG
jgi:hypothetical protein